jgi:hypothetical protein
MGDGASSNAPEPWNGWTGQVAHPNSPSGGGGPGGFRTAGVAGQDPTSDTDPNSPRTRLDDSLQALNEATVSADSTLVVTKPAPTTVTSTTTLLEQQTSLLDVSVSLRVLADSTDGDLDDGTAETRYDVELTPNIPAYSLDEHNKVSSTDGKFTMVGPINIQTFYGPNAKPNDPAIYGRGTTKEDVASGDTTLGFHESCHRADYIDFYKNTPVPVFKGEIGMTQQKWDAASRAFDTAYKAYRERPDAISYQSTDQHGNPTLSQYNAKNKTKRKH